MQFFSMLISSVLSFFNLSYVPLSIYSSGSRFTQFRPCLIQSFIGTILIIDRHRTSLYPNLRNNAGTVSSLLRILLIPLTLSTTLFRTRRLDSHLFPSQEKSIALRVIHQVVHSTHHSSKQLSTPLHVYESFMDLVETVELWPRRGQRARAQALFYTTT